ncbi:hypothetical protein [Thiolapillus sp.]|uniref:hypothetical protein n=1 Tax=Thiolapillus sp. TaxID=2017437 RepID=UPI0025D7D96A|nr:hypothetical protein [Thiolapillus sp.]
MTRTAGAQIGCQRPSRFWGLGCPKIYHEAEDTLVSFSHLKYPFLFRCRQHPSQYKHWACFPAE